MEFLTWFSKFYDRFGDEKGHNKFMPQNLTVTKERDKWKHAMLLMISFKLI